MTAGLVHRVLFLCTGNSARSILAEAILNHVGGGRFEAYSAGSKPKGAVHSGALRLLQRLGYSTAGLSSKSWDVFAAPDAPVIDIIITVCANAAGEVCPVWPGHPTTAHWALPDPATVTGDEAAVDLAFAATHEALLVRLEALTRAPEESLQPARRAAFLAAIHAAFPEAEGRL